MISCNFQVQGLQRMKSDPRTAISVTERPAQYLERQHVYRDSAPHMMEHQLDHGELVLHRMHSYVVI